MYLIDKTFDFCYGHRVWSQTLNSEYSLDSCLACRHLHGHQGQIKVFLKSNKLNQGMVTDFKHLNWFKKWVDDVLDHKFIIDYHDPLFNTILPHYHYQNNGGLLTDTNRFTYHDEGYWTPILFPNQYPQHVLEMYEGYVIVDFVPTSENLSNWLFNIVKNKMKEINVEISHIEFNETPKSRSTYYEQ